ncbi:MAG: rcc01693 family protein [bacterium]
MNAIDWPGLMRVGLLGLGLTPEVFWRLTPVELKIMLGAERGSPALTRTRLSELTAAFPDAGKAGEDDGYRGSDGSDRGA